MLLLGLNLYAFNPIDVRPLVLEERIKTPVVCDLTPPPIVIDRKIIFTKCNKECKRMKELNRMLNRHVVDLNTSSEKKSDKVKLKRKG